MLHLKYRPSSLEEVVGNKEIKSVIQDMVNNERYTHLMFEGTMGCGKTTLAYIIANLWGAPEENIIDRNCVDLSKVEDTRELLHRLTKTTIFGGKKVLILDEIHGLSKSSQEAFLKPLEERGIIQNKTIAIACTTTTENVKSALLGRFKRLKISPLSKEESMEFINYISKKEGINLSKSFKALVAEKSEGIPRSLLINLDTIRSVTDFDEALYLLDLNALEGNPDALELVRLLLNGTLHWQAIKNTLSSSIRSSSPSSLRAGMINIMAHRLTSNYLNSEEEAERLSASIDVLRKGSSYLEKALFINDFFKCFKILVRGE